MLPDDIIREIAAYLDDEYDYVHFIKTCRQFRRAATDPRRVNQGWRILRYYANEIRKSTDDEQRFGEIISNPNFSLRFLKNERELFFKLSRKAWRDVHEDYWEYELELRRHYGPEQRPHCDLMKIVADLDQYAVEDWPANIYVARKLSKICTIDEIATHPLKWNTIVIMWKNPNITLEWVQSIEKTDEIFGHMELLAMNKFKYSKYRRGETKFSP